MVMIKGRVPDGAGILNAQYGLKCYFWAQMSGFRSLIVFCALTLAVAGCANIQGLPGGKKDTKAPVLVRVSPKDSTLNTRVSKIELHFDEFINVVDAVKEVQISPILSIPMTVTGAYKKVTVKIPDSLLQDNTTYRVSFGNAIKDLHEGNTFTGYTYTFSTGSYFDSLEVKGEVLNAVTGMPDTGAWVLLYNANNPDSVVLREKPLYVGKVDGGRFSIKGLPGRSFRVFALRDANNNLIYDGRSEWIAFKDEPVRAGDSSATAISLRLFPEVQDTSKFRADSLKALRKGQDMKPNKDAKTELTYTLNVDTSGMNKRTKDITKPIEISLNKKVDSIYPQQISLYLDSSDKTVPIAVYKDSSKEKTVLVKADWKENTLYTLKIHKGFAKDTSGNETAPSKYVFRTKEDDDYGKLNIHLPKKYINANYVLLVKGDKDTVYQQTVADSMVYLVRQQPGSYSMLLIADANGNGKWDTGDMLAHLQPEIVIPYKGSIVLKEGWENTIDFETNKKPRMGGDEKDNTQNRK